MTVRELIQEIIAVLQAAAPYVECCCEDDRTDNASDVLSKIEHLLIRLIGRPR